MDTLNCVHFIFQCCTYDFYGPDRTIFIVICNDVTGLKQGEALSPLLFNFVLEYSIKRVQVNQDGLKLNGKHQLLAYADEVNILGGSVHTVKENGEALVVAAKEIGIEVNADKPK